MSVETLEMLSPAEHAAGEAIGLDVGTMQAIAASQRPRVISFEIPVVMDDGTEKKYSGARAVSGHKYLNPAPSDPGQVEYNKGGTRFFRKAGGNISAEAEALSVDMESKLCLLPGDIAGGKTVIGVPEDLSHNETVRLFRSLGGVMLEKGIGGHDKSVPAGDMGTNDTDFMDAYTEAFEESGDPFYQASITGKSVANGGLEFRPHATGYGVYLAAVEQRKALGITGPTRITISGAGNVGGYAGYYACQDEENQFVIGGYSDRGSTLISLSDEGIIVTRELMDIMEDPNFPGDKLVAMHAAIKRAQPNHELILTENPRDIMTVPTDIFIPASVRHLIDAKAAASMPARAVVEAGNDTITEEAAVILARRGIKVMPGALANIGGVAVSLKERAANIKKVLDKNAQAPTFDQTQIELEDYMRKLFADAKTMARRLETTDMELAINALIVVRKALRLGYKVNPRYSEIVDMDILTI